MKYSRLPTGSLRLMGFLSFFLTFVLIPPLFAMQMSFKSSTQCLWGDDLLGDSEPILAQYLRMDGESDDEKVLINGYGRFSKDFGDGVLRDDAVLGRLYYMYADLDYIESASFRLGRQFINYSTYSSVLDGLTVDFHGLSKYIGVSVAATLAAAPHSGAAHQEGAKKYLLVSNVQDR